jgi:thiamine kinase-like enzyme
MSIEPQAIKRYLMELPPALLGVESGRSVEILGMIPGSYNLNFHVRINHKEFMFRINVEQQSGIANQVAYEFNVLNILKGHRIAPKAYYFDAGRDHFNFDILIEEYLPGPPLALEQRDIVKVAPLLVKLHSIDPRASNLVTWHDPLAATFDLARNDLNGYQTKKSSNKKIIDLAEQLLAEAAPTIATKSDLFAADSINHTDVAFDNFIMTTEGLRLIDWEKPRVDDGSYDLACFLSEPAQLWCSSRTMNTDEKNNFLQQYAQLSGIDPALISKKVHIREPLVSLHWILWGATKLCDLYERRTAPELVQAHEEKALRYERIANPANIEKLLESN